MSDALTDIKRSEKIAKFLSEEVEPTIKAYWDGKISKEECVKKLKKALDEAPLYTGYWCENPTLIITKLIGRVKSYGRLGLIKSRYVFEFDVNLNDSKEDWHRELKRLKKFIDELNKVVEVIEEYLK